MMKTADYCVQVQGLLRKANVKKPPVPVIKIAEQLGVKLKVGPLPDDLSGFLLHEESNVFIGVNSLHPKTRQAFSVAHEIGHFLLHPTANFVDRGFFYFRNKKSALATDVREIEANQFAAELLMPESFVTSFLRGKEVDIENESQIQALAKNFGVSTQAMVFRLINLNLAHR